MEDELEDFKPEDNLTPEDIADMQKQLESVPWDEEKEAALQKELQERHNHPEVISGPDPALLLVRGKNGENKQYIKSLAHAIVIVIGKYGYANLKCVGASSVNNGIKAYTIASGEAKTHGVNLVLSSGFQSATFDEVEKTAMMLKIFDR